MPVREPGQPPQIHPQRWIQPLDMGSANPILVWVAKLGNLFAVGYSAAAH
jgi:hypothetical protein